MHNQDNNESSNLLNKENILFLLRMLKLGGFITAKRHNQLKRAVAIAHGDKIQFKDFMTLYQLIKEDFPDINKFIKRNNIPTTFKQWWEQVKQGVDDVQSMRKAAHEESLGINQSRNPNYVESKKRPLAGTSNDVESAVNLPKRSQEDINNQYFKEHPNLTNQQKSNIKKGLRGAITEKDLKGSSVTNLPDNTQVMPTPIPVERQLVNSETPVDDIPLHFSRRTPFRKTEQAILGYQTYKPSQTLSTTTAIANCYRLNSIYDCETITTHDDDPSTTALDTADATVNKPMWRNYYINYYRFWHVVGCKWKVIIEPTYSVNTRTGQYTAYLYFHGLEHPPLQTASGALIEHKYRVQHPGVMWKHFITPWAGISTSAGGGDAIYTHTNYVPNQKNDNLVEFSGFWKPGMIKHEVSEDEIVETWHKAEDVPPTPELMTILVQPGPRNEATATDLKYRVYVELEYYTQFKDLKTIYQWVMPDSDIPAITDYVAQSD